LAKDPAAENRAAVKETSPMTQPVAMAELWRGNMLESRHLGHAVIVGANGGVEHAWGDPGTIIFPRSSCKMIQALPLVESGAADTLTSEHLALACASHNGAAIHTDRVQRWLADLGLSDDDLRCGPQEPADRAARDHLIKTDQSPCQYHNNCSGKHSGFLTLNRHLGGGPDYIDPDHPVQRAVKAATEEVTAETSPGYGIDGCSAPNFATSLTGLARAMAAFASARATSTRGRAMIRLREAMVAHPDLVAGEGRSCTELMRAMDGVAVKTGAEAVFVAILPKPQLGIAVKITDGGTRGAECAITALLAMLGAIDPAHPAAQKRLKAPQLNRRGIDTGVLKSAPGFP
jgi:L-asparaginase II